MHLDNGAGDLRGDRGGVVGADAALAVEQHREIGPLQLEDLGFQHLGRRRLRLGRFHGDAHSPGREGTDGENDDGNEEADKHQEDGRAEGAPEIVICQIRRRGAWLAADRVTGPRF